MEVSLSILTIDFLNTNQKLNELEGLNYIHMDVMDGHFVPNISFGPAVIKAISKERKEIIDTHLMISNPIDYIEEFVKAGSHYITFHVEANSDVIDTINKIKSYGVKAGISIKPNTTVEEIKEYLPLVDMVLVMSVEPGFGGQKFMMQSIDKVKLLKELKEEYGYSYLINIDGGINDTTAPYIAPYVDLAVSGSYVVNNLNPNEALLKLKNI